MTAPESTDNKEKKGNCSRNNESPETKFGVQADDQIGKADHPLALTSTSD